MATPIIVFNTSTGSDTTASGSSGSVVANGTSASFTGSVVTLDGSPDLSGFSAADDVLWLATDSGRQWFDLSAADDGVDTVTCVDAPAGTASGLTWGIGGKRNDWQAASSRRLFTDDLKDNWIVETETAQSIDSSLDPTMSTTSGDPSKLPVVRGSSGSRKLFTQTTDDEHFDFASANVGGWKFERLIFENTAGTKNDADGIEISANMGASVFHVFDCEFGDATNDLDHGISADGALYRIASITVVDSYFHDCVAEGLLSAGTAVTSTYLYNSMFVENGADGCSLKTNAASLVVIGCVFANNTTDGLVCRLGSSAAIAVQTIYGNTFAFNGGDGIEIGGYTTSLDAVRIMNNIFSDNSAYGIGGTNSGILAGRYHMRNNDFYNNTSGAIEEPDLVDTDGSTANPTFTASASNDFSIGTNLKALGIPNDIGKAGLTTSFTDIGAAQREEPASGGGLLVHPGMTGGARG